MFRPTGNCSSLLASSFQPLFLKSSSSIPAITSAIVFIAAFDLPGLLLLPAFYLWRLALGSIPSPGFLATIKLSLLRLLLWLRSPLKLPWL